jgi:DNA polymerase-3 subunit beta
MDLQVTQENLNKALSNVARVAAGRSTLPILKNILIQTDNNRLRVSATNLDIAITQHVGTKIKTEGTLTVPARLFQDFISNLPKTTIHLKQEDHKLHITADKYKSTINGTLADEYPLMPAIQTGKKISLPVADFKKALQQVIFAASSDEARPVLTAVYVHTIKKVLYIAATDSYRLAEKQLGNISEDISLLIPASALQELLRVMGDGNDTVNIYYDDQQVRFLVDDIELIARLIDGTYPDYKKLIPDTFSTRARVPKDQLITITKISGLFSRENAGSITVSASELDETLSVKSIASQVGENEASANGSIAGDGSITLNSRYLLDGLQALEGNEVNFCFNGKLEPIIIKSPDVNDYLHVIMPLKS